MHSILVILFLRTMSIFVLFQGFKWLDFRQDVPFTYSCIEDTVIFLQKREILFDDSSLFDQTMNLVRFIDKKKKDDNKAFFAKSCNDKICTFFAANSDPSTYSEILKMAHFFLLFQGTMRIAREPFLS